MFNVCSGPFGEAAVKLLAYDQRAMNAIREVREMMQPWGDGESAQMIRGVLNKWGV